MIIFNYPYGRLGNQLQLAAHLITFSYLEKKRICLKYLNDSANSFPYFDDSPLRSFPRLSNNTRWLERFLTHLFNHADKYGLIPNIDFLTKNEWVIFDTDSSIANTELNKLKSSLLCTTKLWRFRSAHEIIKLKPIIHDVFTPSPEILRQGKDHINSLNCDIVIGVHIRWGDYKTAVPDCYHDISIFKQRMLEARALFPNESVGFVVCTEEQITLAELSDLICVFPKGDAINDLYTLAQTDYLIASASTFSEWAAYWGEIPSFTVIDPTLPIKSLNDFLIVDLTVNF